MADAIRNFFKKKKADIKFSRAGGGQRLGDANQAQQEAARRQAMAASASSSFGHHSRSEPSNQARAAASAALARYNNDKSGQDFAKSRSQAAIRAQALKELEKEKQIDEECAKLKLTYGEKPVVELNIAPSAPGVFYKCPLIGPNILPKDEMRQKIKEFLYSQLTEEQGLTSCLIIHTCNNSEKVSNGVETIRKYLGNIIANPDDEKFRKIRKGNKVYAEKVANLEGHDLFLSAAGFTSRVMDEQEFWVYEREPVDLEALIGLNEALMTAEPIKAELDRNLKVLLPSQAKERITVPPDFFNITPEELRREQQAKTELLEREGMLRTKAMREKEEIREKRKYKFALIRVRFPDGFILQGTFSVYETFENVFEFVGDCLELPLDFILSDAVGQRRLNEEASKSILDVGGLVPSSILNFAWNDVDLTSTPSSQIPYLKSDLLSLASSSST